MISFKQIPPKDFNKSHNPKIPKADEIKSFKKELSVFLSKALSQKEEEFQKNEINKFLAKVYSYDCNTRGKIDSAIYVEDKAKVLIEVKSTNNKKEFPESKDNPLSKALYESILYFLREYEEKNNNSIKHIILCNPCEFYIFNADAFEIFLKDKEIENFYKNCDKKEGVNSSTDKFYKDLQSYLKTDFDKTLQYTYFRLDSNLSEEALSAIYTLLSPQVLLDQKNIIDANTLNKGFYEELLYILGLQEVSENGKSGGKILITPSTTKNTLSDTIRQTYPKLDDEAIFTLITTWNNRLLFLRLLESMLLSCQHIQKPFLNTEKITDFSHLSRLFFGVLAKKQENRNEEDTKLFGSIPYLNSSLFDRIPLEYEGKEIGLLASNHLAIFSRSILKKNERFKNKESLPLLDYLFEFLHAYDFTTTAKDIQDDAKQNHDLLINSAVLGLVFEKLNGYKEGSFYTPSFITSYMCKESITQAVIEKFNSTYGWECDTLEELQDEMLAKGYAKNKESYLATLLSIRICDPAVGSGHFLVSSLNEMIKICYDLRLIKSLAESSLSIENDEILIYTQDKIHQYIKPISQEQQTHQIQVELFHLKKSIIENCLFGVDINPNSCEITKLRLWIELLKYGYYLFDAKGENTNALETLPNIDINIKCGNSLISYFGLDDSFSHIPNIKEQINQYKYLVKCYKAGIYENKIEIDKKILDLQQIFKNFCLTQKYAKESAAFLEQCRKYSQSYGDYLAREDKELSKYVGAGLFILDFDEKKAQKDFQVLKDTYTKIFSLEANKPFEWRFAFPEVLDDEGNFLGFDCVIGNPPYIRIQEMQSMAEIYRKKYNAYISDGFDICILFLYHSILLLKNKGYSSFILSNKFFKNKMGEKIRKFISANSYLYQIIDFGTNQVFESATTYVGIVTLKKDKNLIFKYKEFLSKEDITKLEDLVFEVMDSSFISEDAWNFENPEVLSLVSKLKNQELKFYDIADKIAKGSSSGNDEIFLFDILEDNGDLCIAESKRGRFKLEKSLLVPFLYGEDVKRLSYCTQTKYLFYPYDKQTNRLIPIDTFKSKFPHAFQYLTQMKKELMNRKLKMDSDDFYKFSALRNVECYANPKILIPDILVCGRFGFDPIGLWHNASIHNIKLKPNFFDFEKMFLGILNSSTFWFFVRNTSTTLSGDAYRLTPLFIAPFSFPKITESNQSIADKIIALVEKILALKESDPKADTQDLEKEIDSLVYTLYGLSDDEIKIIEGEK